MSSIPRAMARRATRGGRNPLNLTDGPNRAARRQHADIIRLSAKAQQRADASQGDAKPDSDFAPVIDLSVRATARQRILHIANAHILSERRDRRIGSARTGIRQMPARLLSMRQIREAVCVCRRNQLVSQDLLAQAGWRARAVPAVELGEAA